jgi:hypothetical protein
MNKVDDLHTKSKNKITDNLSVHQDAQENPPLPQPDEIPELNEGAAPDEANEENSFSGLAALHFGQTRSEPSAPTR